MTFDPEHLDAGAYGQFLQKFGQDEKRAFVALARPIIERFFLQTGRPPINPKVLDAYLHVLWQVCIGWGMPKALPEGEKGSPKDLGPDEIAELMTRILDELDYPEVRFDLAVLSKQFLKSVLQPEFVRCRLSYAKPNETGICERQDLRHCSSRISGSHCVDCPLFILTNPVKHPKILASQWNKSRKAELEENLTVFLPEDFRQMKYFLWLQRRYGLAL